MATVSAQFSRKDKGSYGMTYSRIFHFNEYFFSANLVETNGCQLERRFWLRYDESLGFNIFEGHFVILVIFLVLFPLLFNLTVKSNSSHKYTSVPGNLRLF